ISGVAQAQYQVGDQVTTNFTLQDVYGETHSLNDYQGQCVLINFFACW
ncbi:MAG: redoxin domain-containing protein, partial [Candidatus Delongbacteria bacterium]|nr:redoxin domain-containing protein [Candidatus Delongbacteria bacterium]